MHDQVNEHELKAQNPNLSIYAISIQFNCLLASVRGEEKRVETETHS